MKKTVLSWTKAKQVGVTLGFTSMLIAVSACSTQQEDNTSLRSSQTLPSMENLPKEALEHGFALTYSKLPSCRSYRDGEIRYVVDQDEFFTCNSNSRIWEPIDLKGEKGDKGDTGAQGVQGDTGEQGIQGIQGTQGEKGDKGDKGDTGANGQQGFIHGRDGVDSRSKLHTEAASSEQCSTGGVLVVNYLDMDNSGSYDATFDAFISQTAVCNGTNGEDSISKVTLLDATPEECPNGGIAVVSYLDKNANNEFDSADGDLIARKKLCNQTSGEPNIDPDNSCVFESRIYPNNSVTSVMAFPIVTASASMNCESEAMPVSISCNDGVANVSESMLRLTTQISICQDASAIVHTELSSNSEDAMQSLAATQGWPINLGDNKFLFATTNPNLTQLQISSSDQGPLLMHRGMGFRYIAIESTPGSNYGFIDEADGTLRADAMSRAYDYDGDSELISIIGTGKGHLERYFNVTNGNFEPRTIRVLLPKSGNPTHVIYAQDGQNLFDPGAIWGGWNMQSTLQEFPNMMIVGIDSNANRIHEFTHVEDRIGNQLIGGGG